MAECEKIAELLSAWIDEELEQDEVSRLEEHLKVCQACRGLKKRFETVDRLAKQYSCPPESDFSEAGLTKAIPAIESSMKSGGLTQTSGSGWRKLANVAVAALVLIAVSLVIIATGDRAEARRSAAQNLAALEVTNQEAVQGQEAVLKSLEWDLNAMKLAVSCSDLEGENSNTLLNRIEELLNEVNRIKADQSAQ